jgi:hypothetical protein
MCSKIDMTERECKNYNIWGAPRKEKEKISRAVLLLRFAERSEMLPDFWPEIAEPLAFHCHVAPKHQGGPSQTH